MTAFPSAHFHHLKQRLTLLKHRFAEGRRSRAAAFTVLEMLVVIAVIGIMASIVTLFFPQK